jgi:hypothetical protein
MLSIIPALRLARLEEEEIIIIIYEKVGKFIAFKIYTFTAQIIIFYFKHLLHG